MYLSYYSLNEMPFQISPNPKFLWLGEKHKEALAILKYGVLNNQGFLLLTGDVGTGKTTLINTLLNSLQSDTIIINIPDPRLDRLDFFKLVSHSLGLEVKLETKFDFFVSFKEFLYRAHNDKKQVLLIIDEAQKLSLDSLEEVRLLSNIETQEIKLLNVFFIGQNEFNDMLIQPECRALRQRITMVHQIEPLDEKETADYVRYRLRVAGSQRKLFTDRALRRIHGYSRGYPRLINVICDRALLTGYSSDLRTIDDKVIHETASELRLPGEIQPHSLRGLAQGVGATLRRARRAAFFVCIALVVLLSASLVALTMKGDRFNLGEYFGALFGASGQDQPESPSRKIESRTPGRSSAPSPSPKPGQIDARPAPQSADAKNRIATETSGPDRRFEESKLVIPFGYNTNDLPPQTLAKIDGLADYMLRTPDSSITIRGYTDAVGNTEYNKNLSTFRANLVKIYLTGKGISPKRMATIGMGDAEPRMENTSEEGRSANRRVEIEFVARKPQHAAEKTAEKTGQPPTESSSSPQD